MAVIAAEVAADAAKTHRNTIFRNIQSRKIVFISHTHVFNHTHYEKTPPSSNSSGNSCRYARTERHRCLHSLADRPARYGPLHEHGRRFHRTRRRSLGRNAQPRIAGRIPQQRDRRHARHQFPQLQDSRLRRLPQRETDQSLLQQFRLCGRSASRWHHAQLRLGSELQPHGLLRPHHQRLHQPHADLSLKLYRSIHQRNIRRRYGLCGKQIQPIRRFRHQLAQHSGLQLIHHQPQQPRIR